MTGEDRDRIGERERERDAFFPLFYPNYSHNPIHNQTVKTSMVKSISLGGNKNAACCQQDMSSGLKTSGTTREAPPYNQENT